MTGFLDTPRPLGLMALLLAPEITQAPVTPLSPKAPPAPQPQ
jgi:hypothetical protein